MGMYTELVLKIEVNKGIDEKAFNVLHYMFGGGNGEGLENNLPDHPFFRLPRWSLIGKCSSFYHHPSNVNDWYDVDYSSTIYIFSRSDLKNYDDEINHFLDWVKPYVVPATGSCLGWVWYEEDEMPTLIPYNFEKE